MKADRRSTLAVRNLPHPHPPPHHISTIPHLAVRHTFLPIIPDFQDLVPQCQSVYQAFGGLPHPSFGSGGR